MQYHIWQSPSDGDPAHTAQDFDHADAAAEPMGEQPRQRGLRVWVVLTGLTLMSGAIWYGIISAARLAVHTLFS